MICPPDILMCLACGVRGFQPKLDNSQTQHFVTKADRSENEALA
jgi:hypothetical protein